LGNNYLDSTIPQGGNGGDGGEGDGDEELDGLFESPEDDPPKWVCMLKLYLDESLDDETGMYYVAGYLGNKKQWKNYVDVWRKELNPRKAIHIADLRLGSKRARDRYGDILSRLGRIPAQCGLRAFAGSICRKDYEDKVSGTVLEVIMEGYVLSILSLMDELVLHLNNERVEVFFEEQVIHAALRERAMLVWRKNHKTVSGWSVLARWGTIPKGTLTEAADYLCYALHHFHSDPNSQKALLTAPILAQNVIGNHTAKATIDKWLKQISLSRGGMIPKLTTEAKRARAIQERDLSNQPPQ